MTNVWDLDYSRYHEEWIDYIDGKLKHRDAMTANNMTTIISTVQRQALSGCQDLVRDCTERVGGLLFHQLRGVYLPSGNVVKPHIHKSMVVVLYMPQHHDSAKLVFANPTEELDTVAGRAVEITQARNHWVTKNTGERRITIAVMFVAPSSDSKTATRAG